MAEHNLFLGTAVKSVGDVTLFRRDGKQISRVRVRNVANPRSEAQAETRNFLAPVIRFYGALHDTLARSWQGLNKAKSYAEFQRTNIRLAREQGWFLPKGAQFFPMPYQVSYGSLPSLNYSIQETLAESSLAIYVGPNQRQIRTIGDISWYFLQQGYKHGDVVTCIVVLEYQQGFFRPSVGQFVVNLSDATPATNIGGLDWSFQYTSGHLHLYNGDISVIAGAVIVARFHNNQWLRSTQLMACSGDIVTAITSAEQKAASIKSYQNPERSGDGDSYLDGDGVAYNVATISGRALLFYGGQYNPTILTENAVNFIQLKPANIDDLFFVRDSEGNFLVAGSSASLKPSAWYLNDETPTTASDADCILLQDPSDFYSYMQSIGFTL